MLRYGDIGGKGAEKDKNKPLRDLVQVAEKVYHYRETEEEKKQRKS